MKILTMPNELSNIKDSDGIIIGIKNFSWFIPLEVTVDDLKEIVPKVKDNDQEIFIGLNKLMYNEDIPLLKEYLLIIDGIGVNGILYDDLAVLNIHKSLNLKTPLMWFSPHLFNNYYTANYWYNKGIKYGLLSTEITLDHIKRIKENTSMSLMMYGYGYLPMFVSSRSLLSSYFKYINKDKDNKIYHMYEEARKQTYPTFESGDDTIILSSHIINVIDELPIISNNVDYLILSCLNIPSDIFNQICHKYKEALDYLDDKDKLKQISVDVENISEVETDKGFLYKETVYRVKNDGK